MRNKTFACSDLEDLIAYYENDLPYERNEEIKDHIHNCMVCNKSFKHFKKVKKAINRAEKIETPPKFMNKILNEIARANK